MFGPRRDRHSHKWTGIPALIAVTLGASALPTYATETPRAETSAKQLELTESASPDVEKDAKQGSPVRASAESWVGANKRGHNLRKHDLSGQNMRHVKLHSASLHDADLRDSSLHDADMRHAKLHRAKLHRAKLHRANLQHADMHHATMHYASMRHAKMQDAVLHHAKLHHANFHKAKLHRADLRHTVIHHGVFNHANLQGAKLHHADLSNASMSPARLKHANLTGATMHHAKLAGSSFHNATLHKANMKHVDLTGAIMHNANMHQVVLHKATLHGAKIHNARITKAKLTHVKARKGTWFGTDFAGSNLKGADLSKGDFSKLKDPKDAQPKKKGKGMSAQAFCPSCSSFVGANLAGANFSGAYLAGVDFTNANLAGANLSNANLYGAVLTGANLAGANMTGAKLDSAQTDPFDASLICQGANIKATNVTISSGVIASYNVGWIAGQGTISVTGANGATLSGSFACTNNSWTITITGSSGFTPNVNGMTAGSFSGTITKTGKQPAEWNVTANATIVRSGVTVNGKLTLQGNNRWMLNATAASGSVTDSTGTSTINSASGFLVFNATSLVGNLDLNLSNGATAHSRLRNSLPAGWTTSTKLRFAFSVKSLYISDAVPTLKVDITAKSASGADSVTFTGDWAQSGYALTASGTFKVKGQSMSVSGYYQSVGYTPTGGTALANAACAIDVSVSNVAIGNGAKLDNGTLSAVCGTPGITGTATLIPELDSSARLVGTLVYVDSANWVFTLVNSASSTNWSPANLPGLSIDPSKISGTVTSATGNVTWNLTVGSVLWSNMTTGVNVSTGFTISNACPIASCGGASGLFLSLVGAQATFPSPIGTIPLTGAVAGSGSWAYVQSAPGSSLSVNGPGGSAISISNPSMTMWKGAKPTSAAAGVSLPDLSSLDSRGWGIEFAGTFGLNIPSVVSTTTTGAITWTPNGVMLGMVGIGGSSPGASGSNYSVGSTAFDGWAWTNLSLTGAMSKATLNGVTLPITKSVNNLTGSMALPDNVLGALKLPSGYKVPAIATVSLDGSVEEIQATVPLNFKSNGVQLETITFDAGKNGSNFSVSLIVNAYADIDGHHIALSGGFRAASGGGLSFFLSATGTGGQSDPCGCDGISTAFTSPQSSDKVYIVDNYLGMPGAHLWAVTAQVQLVNGMPGLGVDTAVYLDPSKSTALHGTTWMKSSFQANVSEVDPCFRLGFGSNDPNTYLQVKGGVLQTQNFQIAFAPKGCTIGSDTIPQGASLMFRASFGNKSNLTIALMIGKDESGQPKFSANMSLTNLVLNGLTFEEVSLVINMTPTAQSMKFVGNFSTSVGSMKSNLEVSKDLSAGACDKFALSGAVSLNDWKLSSVDFDLNSMNYSMNVDSCGSFDTQVSGNLNLGPKKLDFAGELKYDHGILQIFNISVQYTRGSISQALYLQYYKDQTECSAQNPCFNGKTLHEAGSFDGGLSFNYVKHTTHGDYERHVQIYIAISFAMNFNNPGNGKLTLAGTLEASKLSGSINCTISGSGDDSCHASFSIRINDVINWSDSWNW